MKNDQLAANAVPNPAPTIAGRTPAKDGQFDLFRNVRWTRGPTGSFVDSTRDGSSAQTVPVIVLAPVVVERGICDVVKDG